MTRVSFLGPRGTFAEAALRTLAIADAAELLPAASVHEALRMVRAGESDLALVPIENSVEGAVTLTLDDGSIHSVALQGEGCRDADGDNACDR